MSAPAYPLPRLVSERPEERRLSLASLAPREGWSAFALVVFMLVLVGWSLHAADYRGGDLDWLAGVMIVGASWGLLAARVGLPRWEAHALGALIGGGVVLVLAAGGASSDPDVGARLSALGQAAAQWYRDVSGPSHLSQQNVAWQVTCGVVSWATAQHASYAVFGHRRPLVAIVIPGTFLLVNMLIAADVDLLFLVLFTASVLLLLVRTNLVDQREAWARRRIGEAADVGSVAARSGTILVSAAVVLAMVLAAVGSSAPLGGLSDTFQGRAQDVALRVNDWFNLSPAVRFHGDAFETSQVITGEWDASEVPALRVSTSDDGTYYLRATTYDGFVEGNRWIQDGVRSTPVKAGASLLDELAGDGDLALDARSEVTARVTTLRDARVVFSPAVPASVSIPVRLDRLGDGGPFAALRPPGDSLPAGTTYEIVALVPQPGAAGLTKNQLRRAGDGYPTEILARYVTIDSTAFDESPAGHPSVAQLAADLIREGRLGNAFDIADAFQWYLSDSQNFSYSSNVRGKCTRTESAADCFLRIRQGYCQYYATTMILMLRSQGIPARLAVGYLPPGSDGIVLSSSAHAWVEVYFPGYGWASFDPTGGNGAAPVAYAEGPVAGPTPGATPVASGALGGLGRGALEGESEFGGGGLPGEAGASLLPVVLFGVAGAAGLGLAAMAWWRRSRRPPDVVAVYGGVTRIAGLLGFPRRPWQTVFEYAGILADVVPEARPELEAVAQAKVESTYRPVPLARERLEAAAEAYRRLRLGLTRLVFRRGRLQAVEDERRRRSRGPRLPGQPGWGA